MRGRRTCYLCKHLAGIVLNEKVVMVCNDHTPPHIMEKEHRETRCGNFKLDELMINDIHHATIRRRLKK